MASQSQVFQAMMSQSHNAMGHQYSQQQQEFQQQQQQQQQHQQHITQVQVQVSTYYKIYILPWNDSSAFF